MTTKLVCRLLSADGRLLGWESHYAAARGDGYLRSTLPVVVDVDEPGDAAVVSIHWADMNVETRVPMPATTVKQGDALTIFQPHFPMIQVGEVPAFLAPVTVKTHQEVAVPVGQMGAMSV